MGAGGGGVEALQLTGYLCTFRPNGYLFCILSFYQGIFPLKFDFVQGMLLKKTVVT